MLLLLFNDYNSETKTDTAVQEPVKGSRETLLIFNQLCVIGEAKHSAHTAMPHSWLNISKVSLYIHCLVWRSAVMWWFTFTLWSVAYSSALASNYLCLFNLLLLLSQFDILDISFKHRL